MALGMALFVIVIAIGFGVQLTSGRSTKRKWIVWALLLMFGIGPFVSFLMGIGYGVYVGDGFAGGALLVLLAGFFFVVGLIMLLVGILKKA